MIIIYYVLINNASYFELFYHIIRYFCSIHITSGSTPFNSSPYNNMNLNDSIITWIPNQSFIERWNLEH